MPRTVAIGEQDFSAVIEKDYFYLDKTAFLKEWWENGDTVTLITRPRRFGKTLTMSMLDYFFSVKHAGRSGLFEKLMIWKEEKYRKLQGTYPVIFLSFAEIKSDKYDEVYYEISRLIAREYRRHAYLLESGHFLTSDKDQFHKIVSCNGNISDICSSINLLSEYLYEYYGKKVIVLLDEYDTPIQEAYLSGYWNKFVKFMRKFMNATFKTNSYLERGLMTGITRISKESVFSDLNNLAVITTTTPAYETVFGFMEKEVFQALEEYGLQNKAGEVKQWYDGFHFGDCDSIYNPWSIINYLKYKEFKPYWANTSSNVLVGALIRESDVSIKIIMEDLLHGDSFRTQLDEEIVFRDLKKKKSAIWSLLLASGYLKFMHMERNRMGDTEYVLSLTNTEVFVMFKNLFAGWFSSDTMEYSEFSNALLSGDKIFMNAYLNDIAQKTISFFDTGVKPSSCKPPENFYHGFVLGLIANLRKIYKITSNRESGLGRYDVLMEPYNPKQDDGIILEFKVISPDKEKSLEDTVQAAIQQIIDKKYAAALESKCTKDRIRIYGFAFRGNMEILIDGGYLCEYCQV